MTRHLLFEVAGILIAMLRKDLIFTISCKMLEQRVWFQAV